MVVLPKVWGWGSQNLVSRQRACRWPPERPLVLYEGESCTLHLGDDPTVRATRAELLEQVLQLCDTRAEEEQDADKKTGAVPLPREAYRLVSWTPPQPKLDLAPIDERDGMRHLASLLLLRRRLPAQYDPATTSRRRSEMLAPLLHELYCREVERMVRWVRRGYVPEEASVPSVRGRVVTRSLALHQVRGGGSLACRYDEFTEGTPLFRVLATALEVAAHGTWLDDMQATASLDEAGPTRSLAIRLRRFLSTVPSLERRHAALVARTLRLPPAARRWAQALDLARDVLEESGPDWRQEQTRSGPRVWTLDTAGLWEDLLDLALCSKGEKPRTQKEVPEPWKGLGGKGRLDLLLRGKGPGEGDLIIDAKYGWYDPDMKQTPHRQYLYQMYAYAHLHPRCARVALVFPRRGGAPLRSTPAIPIQGRATLEPAPSLVLARLRFPQPSEVGDPTAWGDYLEALGDEALAQLAP